MEHAVLNGWDLAFEEAGSGPPIILIHGLLMDHTMFAPQVAVLKDRYRVITPDLRNHGESESRAESHSQWDGVEDAIALCDKLSIDRAVFGGVSQGGFQSLRAAIRYPERVAGLILIETQAGAEDPSLVPIYEGMAQVVAADGWNDFILESTAALLFGTSASADLKNHWTERWRNLTTAHAVQTLQAVTTRDDVTDRLSEITAPALVIHGIEDAAISMDRAEAMANGLPGLVEFVKLEHAGHSATVEQPDLVNAAIERFLKRG